MCSFCTFFAPNMSIFSDFEIIFTPKVQVTVLKNFLMLILHRLNQQLIKNLYFPPIENNIKQIQRKQL